MSSLPVVPDFPDGLSEERDELSPLVTFDQVRTEKSIYTMILPAAKRRVHKLVYFQWGLVLVSAWSGRGRWCGVGEGSPVSKRTWCARVGGSKGRSR